MHAGYLNGPDIHYSVYWLFYWPGFHFMFLLNSKRIRQNETVIYVCYLNQQLFKHSSPKIVTPTCQLKCFVVCF